MNRKYRLCKSDSIYDTLRSNTKLFCEIANIYYKRNNTKLPKIAIIVSKKNFPLAVNRNKIKRQARAILQYKLELLGAYNIVIVIKNNWNVDCFHKNKFQINKIMHQLFVRGGKDEFNAK